jgi:hypothetical protein
MAPLVSGAESGGTIEKPLELAASERTLQTCERDSARSQFARVGSDECRQTPKRVQQRPFCRPAAGAISDKSMSLEPEEDHDVNSSIHNLSVHLRTCTASSELFETLSEGGGDKQGIWRTHAALINHEGSDMLVCYTTQAQARDSDSAITDPTYAQLYSTPFLGSPSPCPSQITPDTCVMPFDPHTPNTALRFEDFVNFTPTELQARWFDCLICRLCTKSVRSFCGQHIHPRLRQSRGLHDPFEPPIFQSLAKAA